MGGKLKDGYCIIGGVTKDEVKLFFDKLVEEKKFESRSKAIGNALTQFMKNYHKEVKNDESKV